MHSLSPTHRCDWRSWALQNSERGGGALRSAQEAPSQVSRRSSSPVGRSTTCGTPSAPESDSAQPRQQRFRRASERAAQYGSGTEKPTWAGQGWAPGWGWASSDCLEPPCSWGRPPRCLSIPPAGVVDRSFGPFRVAFMPVVYPCRGSRSVVADRRRRLVDACHQLSPSADKDGRRTEEGHNKDAIRTQQGRKKGA